ncbi:MAG: helix-turn-helix domain-containing protein [Lentilactobacillus diolivorans]|uniref:TetR/AcrR family transcriptional regulator n=1 Tax=Lentilactobacillus diolivorans TaxID=179838 RepID=UPI0039EBF868
MAENKAHRRRGKALEDAILDATWQLIQTTGYLNMTMDDIAKSAHTNKNAIYRRWKTKLDVGIAAMRKNVPFQKFYLPDNGNLRADLIELLSESVPTVHLIGIKNIKEIARDAFKTINEPGGINVKQFSTHPDQTPSEGNFITQNLLKILKRSFDRNEIETDPASFDPTVMNLPLLLMMSRIIGEEAYNLETVTFFVDKVLLPVFKSQ